MNTSSTTKCISIGALSTVLVALIYLFASSPGRVVVNADESIDGFVNTVRSKLQGERFWRQQLLQAKLALEWKLSAPERQAKRNARIAEFEERTNRRLEELYQRNSTLRPSPANQKAEALRAEADSIENDELEKQMEAYRLRRIAELQQIVDFLEARSE